MKLSDQAMGAIMMALQNSLMEQTDIVPVLRGFKFEQTSDSQLVVQNPPHVKASSAGTVITEVEED